MAIKKKTETAATEVKLDVKVTRVKEFNSGDISFDVIVNGVNVYGLTLKEYQGHNFIAFPSHKGSDDKYYNYAWFKVDENLQNDIEEQISNLL